MGLSVEVLRLYLSQANLTTSGSKKALVDRMLENGIFPSDMATDSGSGDEQGGIENEALPDNEEASSSGDPHSSGEESHSHADAIRPVVVPARRTKAARPASTARSVSSERPRRRHSVSKRSREKTHRHKRKRHSRRHSSSSSSRSRPRHRRHRRTHSRSSRSSSSSSTSSSSTGPSAVSPFVACTATPPKHLIRRIRLGKFIKFDKLLPVHDELVFGGRERLGTDNKRQRPAKRQVHDLASWLEAWNIFLAVRVQSHPREALQLVKYQAIICHLFTAYSAAACLKYDSLFRQAAARDKSKLIAWDHLKEDILVWCATRQPFWPSKFQPAGQADSRVTGPPSTPSGRITHTSTGQEIVWGTSPGTLIPTALE